MVPALCNERELNTPTALAGAGWRKSCGLLLGEEVAHAPDYLADARPAAGVTAVAARHRPVSGPSRSVRALVDPWLVGTDACPCVWLLPPNGAPMAARLLEYRSHGFAEPLGASDEGASDGAGFRHGSCGSCAQRASGSGGALLGRGYVQLMVPALEGEPVLLANLSRGPHACTLLQPSPGKTVPHRASSLAALHRGI